MNKYKDHDILAQHFPNHIEVQTTLYRHARKNTPIIPKSISDW